jgi:AP2 domain
MSPYPFFRIKMHCLLLGRLGVDHKDGNGLNNKRSNLRPCNDAQNQQNTGSRGGSSNFKGVSWVKRRKKWLVAFRCNKQYHFIGWFEDEVEAARAYDSAILPLAGDFARLNFPIAA